MSLLKNKKFNFSIFISKFFENFQHEKSNTPVAKSITPSNNRPRHSPRPNPQTGSIPPPNSSAANAAANVNAAAAAAAAAALQGYQYNLAGIPSNLAGYANELMSQAAAAAARAGGGMPGMPLNYSRPPFPGAAPGLVPPGGLSGFDPNARISIPGLPAGKP